ncbi:hypothetical protein QRX50_46970 [Amycolatopsis carbonis]|uniref:Ku domain-containing protein n=1 Tax=Amycolatopsis carbonis TaxID=715471 RepID=A0A9Y2IFH6_9PSEU|nr:Ku protein [Amycolatopsis sp. 2-15]WIX78797.1 hypothetical protein QRX50_46970 [Amycolatopsis sp. 2-15]
MLLAAALPRTRRVAVARVALRRRETLAALRVRDRTIVLQPLLWPDRIRRPDIPFLHEDVEPHHGELHHAVRLVQGLAPEESPYTDDHRAALEAVVRAKPAGGDVERPPNANRPKASPGC